MYRRTSHATKYGSVPFNFFLAFLNIPRTKIVHRTIWELWRRFYTGTWKVNHFLFFKNTTEMSTRDTPWYEVSDRGIPIDNPVTVGTKFVQGKAISAMVSFLMGVVEEKNTVRIRLETYLTCYEAEHWQCFQNQEAEFLGMFSCSNSGNWLLHLSHRAKTSPSIGSSQSFPWHLLQYLLSN